MNKNARKHTISASNSSSYERYHLTDTKLQQLVAVLLWEHNVSLMSKLDIDRTRIACKGCRP